MKKLLLICYMMFVGTNSVHAARLADREELTRQLLSVDTGMNHVFLREMYPYILDQAGKELDPDSIVKLFKFAQNDFLRYSIRKTQNKIHLVGLKVLMSLRHLTPKLITAILPNNQNEADQALEIYDRSIKSRDISAR